VVNIKSDLAGGVDQRNWFSKALQKGYRCSW